ncbi:unnamed protein product, partial [Meganyctiphanes norvegica]
MPLLDTPLAILPHSSIFFHGYSDIPAVKHGKALDFLRKNTLYKATFFNFSIFCCLHDTDDGLKCLLLSNCIFQLSSVPGLDDVVVPETNTPATTDVAPASDSSAPAPETAQAAAPVAPPADAAPQTTDTVDSAPTDVPQEAVSTIPISKDPRYAPYFKMLSVGVPAQAVKLKMNAEGLDPDLLDNPDAPAPAAAEPALADPQDSDSDSVSSWSDC